MSILILVTGGTFDKEYDELTGHLAFDETHVPQMLTLGRCKLDVEVERARLMDSLDMTDDDRAAIAAACVGAAQTKIVVTHGTDTMVETARVVARAVTGTGKTVIFTGAMIPFAFGKLRRPVQPRQRALVRPGPAPRGLRRHEWALLPLGSLPQEPRARHLRESGLGAGSSGSGRHARHPFPIRFVPFRSPSGPPLPGRAGGSPLRRVLVRETGCRTMSSGEPRAALTRVRAVSPRNKVSPGGPTMRPSVPAQPPTAPRAASDTRRKIDDEHAHLNEMLEVLTHTTDLERVKALLGELSTFLRQHFETEEGPQGMHEIVGEQASHRLPNLQRLIEEHRRLLVQAEQLRIEVCDCLDGPVRRVLAGVSSLAATLRRHEAEEEELFGEAFYSDIGGHA